MDPDTALRNARKALTAFLAASEGEWDDLRDALDCLKEVQEHASDLADAFEALDGWMSMGGFLPELWAKGRAK